MGNKTVLKSPRMVFWESTARCNLDCVHCRRLTRQSRGELSTFQAKDMIAQLAKMGCKVIVFSGGEPLMRSDWQELALFAAENNLPAALATNGTLISEGIAARIALCKFKRVSVSLDSPYAELHDRLRSQKGSFEAASSGIGHLRKHGISFQINMSVNRGNMHQLDEMLEFCKKIGAEALHFFMLVPVGCGADISTDYELSPGQYEDVLNWICDQTGRCGIELRATCSPHYYRVASQRGMDVKHARGCLAGISVMFVSHDGKVFPCGYFPMECGDVTRQPLEEIWNKSPVFNELRDFTKLKGKCGRCVYKTICGGCRARAWAQSGDYLSTEPNCIYHDEE